MKRLRAFTIVLGALVVSGALLRVTTYLTKAGRWASLGTWTRH
jgi:hypothetical protein